MDPPGGTWCPGILAIAELAAPDGRNVREYTYW